MTGFSIDWLNLRERADQRARSSELLERANNWVYGNGKQMDDRVVFDLGAGTGSTLRAFDALTMKLDADMPLHWHLVDQDAVLLTEAKLRHGASHQMHVHVLDLADVESLPLDGACLVTASALFDLVSAKFIDQLSAKLNDQNKRKPLGLYSALNYDGTTSWSPVHPLDDAVLRAFNRDQQRDKGFGEALGPRAGPYMQQRFSELGFTVLSVSSPWLLGPEDEKLIIALVSGIGGAVAEDPALNEAELKSWIEFRQSHATSGRCEVGHRDLLILPSAVD